MNPRVGQISTVKDHTLYLTFSNGEHRIYDCSRILDFGVFQELKNIDYFNQVKVVDGAAS